MIVATCLLTLHIPWSHSLKEKRRYLKKLTSILRTRHNLSVAETDSQDLWQKAVLGLAVVSRNRAQAEQLLRFALKDVEETSGLKTIDCHIEYL